MKQWFLGLSRAGKIVAISVISVLGIGTVGALSDNQPSPSSVAPKPAAVQSQATQEAPKPVVTTKQVKETESVPFETTTVNNPSLEKGSTRVATEGANGTRTTVFEVSYKDGKETSRKEVGSSITLRPVTRVIERGTKVPTPPPAAVSCPNGTYVNSAGNTVCRPYATSSAPAGATAKCRDGTYSFSQSRRGTCSRHGGVAAWL